MSKTNNIPTPRTDAALSYADSAKQACTAIVNLACQLERELAQVTAQRDALLAALRPMAKCGVAWISQSQVDVARAAIELRTDDMEFITGDNVAWADFAGQLERELAQANRQIAMDTECIERIRAHGMKCEAQRDAAVEALRYGWERRRQVMESERSKSTGDHWDFWNYQIEKQHAALAQCENEGSDKQMP